MGSERQLGRIALRGDQVLEFKWPPFPVPPEEMLKLPGVRAWVQEMQLTNKRQAEMLARLVNNLGTVDRRES